MDLSRYDLNDLTPDFVAALLYLDLLNAEAIPDLSMRWLESGSDSDLIAVLASEPAPTLREHRAAFKRALFDMGGKPPASVVEAYWTLTQFLLRQVAATDRSPFPEAELLITKVSWHTDELEMFLRTDLPPVDQRKPPSRYAGESLGIENLIGAVYSLDDFDDHKKHASTIDRIYRNIKDEAARVLIRFYTTKPASFPAPTPLA